MGKYRRYLIDGSIKMPRSTVYYQRKVAMRLAAAASASRSLVVSDSFEPTTDVNTSNDLVSHESTHHEPESHESTSHGIAIPYVEFHDEIFEPSKVDADSSVDDSHDNDFNTIGSSVRTLGHNDLCAMVLVNFFSGRQTQTTFNAWINLVNQISEHNIPASFNSIAKVIFKENNDQIAYTKEYYCNTCRQIVEIANKQKRCLLCHDNNRISK